MAITTSNTGSLSYFRSDALFDALANGLLNLGLVELFVATAAFLALAFLVANVFAGRIFNERIPSSLLLCLLLVVGLTFIPIIEAVSLSVFNLNAISVADGLALALSLLIPTFVLIGSIWGILELMRFAFGIRLETELQRFVATVSVIFIFALTAPSFETFASGAVRRFIVNHSAANAGVK